MPSRCLYAGNRTGATAAPTWASTNALTSSTARRDGGAMNSTRNPRHPSATTVERWSFGGAASSSSLSSTSASWGQHKATMDADAAQARNPATNGARFDTLW